MLDTYITKSTDSSNSYADESSDTVSISAGNPIGLLLALTYAGSLSIGGWAYVSEN